MATAKLLSERIGQRTIEAHSTGYYQPNDIVLHQRVNEGLSEAGRALVDPSEILRMRSDEVLVFMRRQVAAPIKAKSIRYFEERRFAGLFDKWRTDNAASVVAPFPAVVSAFVSASRSSATSPGSNVHLFVSHAPSLSKSAVEEPCEDREVSQDA